MHMHSLAPVLSATSRYEYIWIIVRLPAFSGGVSPRLASCARRRDLVGARDGAPLHDAEQPPVLGLGEAARLHDLHGVALVRLVLLVVDLADRPPLDVLAVAGVLDQARDLHPARLVHLVAGHDAHGGAALP